MNTFTRAFLCTYILLRVRYGTRLAQGSVGNGLDLCGRLHQVRARPLPVYLILLTSNNRFVL